MTLEAFLPCFWPSEAQALADLALEDIQSDSRARVFESCRIKTRKLSCYPELPSRGRSQFCTASPATGRDAGRSIRPHSCHCNKRALRRTAIYLEPEEARAVIGAVDRRGREANATMRCCCFSTTQARGSARPWQYALVISGLERPRQVRLARQRAKGTDLSVVVRNSISLAPDHSGR